MILYPAIDLKDGAAVRLKEGRMDQATVFDSDPAAAAKRFAEIGYAWLHVIDLDGAIAGVSKNAGAVTRIVDQSRVPVQLGGGVRSLEAVDHWLTAGVTRVILGTAAARDPKLVKEAAKDFPERIAVAVDVRDGQVAVSGWVESEAMSALELALRYQDAGVAALIVTDIARDGMLSGPNVGLTGAIADAVDIPVIAAGGMARAQDVASLRARAGKHPIAGAVIGRALWQADFDHAEAMRLACAGAPAP